ncbi:hypothetical protein BIV25_32440 [Streptomyces sp. MUSC 14]|uniref:hypothetical protein n=1 Tax=Streptomyces sp. MUSC 14 TaxID=1354889 RepID=UPI0008F5B537|nr:hypothetical protein [Streptomyces sp. MUSC 14]OIJ90021.1 hypothetical protein BIV25_32440 [Streptomyces sp. MUSC 14]
MPRLTLPRTVLPRRLPLGSPFQLLLLACSFALAACAGIRLFADDWFGVALWIVGAALLHDLVPVPLYGLADRMVVRGLGAAGPRTYGYRPRCPCCFCSSGSR